MSLKKNNEITVKIKGKLSQFFKNIEDKGFKIIDKFSIIDTYFIPSSLNIENMSIRDIISKAILVRNIQGKMFDKTIKKLTFKIKKFDEEENIVSQEVINCRVIRIEDAKMLLKAIGYTQIMVIEEDDIVYEKDGFKLDVKNIKNGDKLIEIETEKNSNFDTIDKLKIKVNELKIPIYTNNYFVKKAEIELKKVLNRKKIVKNKKILTKD